MGDPSVRTRRQSAVTSSNKQAASFSTSAQFRVHETAAQPTDNIVRGGGRSWRLDSLPLRQELHQELMQLLKLKAHHHGDRNDVLAKIAILPIKTLTGDL